MWKETNESFYNSPMSTTTLEYISKTTQESDNTSKDDEKPHQRKQVNDHATNTHH